MFPLKMTKSAFKQLPVRSFYDEQFNLRGKILARINYFPEKSDHPNYQFKENYLWQDENGRLYRFAFNRDYFFDYVVGPADRINDDASVDIIDNWDRSRIECYGNPPQLFLGS